MLAKQLADPAIYHEAIARTVAALQFTRHDESELLNRNAPEIAKRLARALTDGSYVHGPAHRRMVLLDKLRSVVQLTTIDRVVHSAVAALLSRAFESKYSEDLYSYRAGRGRMPIVDRLLAMAAANRRGHDDVRQRGLWVLRFDVASYGDSIPIDDASELWPLLDHWLAAEPPWVHALMRTLVRCAATDEFTTRGVPTGSPMNNPMVNLYLSDLDAEMGKSTPLYVRFGDDVTIVCDSAEACDVAHAHVLATLTRKQLTVNKGKFARFYWNGAGRPPTIPGWVGARHITYVGFDVGYDGTFRAKKSARRLLVHDLVERLRAAGRRLPSRYSPEQRATALAGAARALLDPRSPFVLPALSGFLAGTSCRIQLGEIDRLLATEIASLAAAVGGPKAFQTVTWKSLHRAGLPSLTATKNRGRSHPK